MYVFVRSMYAQKVARTLTVLFVELLDVKAIEKQPCTTYFSTARVSLPG